MISCPRIVLLPIVLGVVGSLAAAESYPFEAQIAGDNVNIRSGPGVNYYPVVQLSRGARVSVQGERHGWLAITPPAGQFSYVAAEFVDLAPDGKSGRVNAENVMVRAGSTLNNKKTSIQSRLNQNETVQVVGEAEGFLKIVPPTDARVWVKADLVQRSDGTRLAGEQTVGTTTAPALRPTPALPTETDDPQPLVSRPPPVRTAVPTPRMAAAIPTPAATPVAVEGDQRELQDVENRMSLILQRPLDEQRFEDVEPAYQRLSGSADLATKTIAQSRLRQITRIRDNQQLLASALQLGEDAQRAAEQYDQRTSEIEQATRPQLRPEFVAQGQLETSYAFRGVRGPKRYRLIEPTSRRTIAYVEVADGLNADQYLGTVVGVSGTRSFDPRSNIVLIQADGIRMIDEGITAGQAEGVSVRTPPVRRPPPPRPPSDDSPALIEVDPGEPLTTQPLQ